MKDFLSKTWKAQNIEDFEYIKIKSVCFTKDTIDKSEILGWEKIFEMPKTDKVLISWLYKECLQMNKESSVKNGQIQKKKTKSWKACREMLKFKFLDKCKLKQWYYFTLMNLTKIWKLYNATCWQIYKDK